MDRWLLKSPKVTPVTGNSVATVVNVEVDIQQKETKIASRPQESTQCVTSGSKDKQVTDKQSVEKTQDISSSESEDEEVIPKKTKKQIREANSVRSFRFNPMWLKAPEFKDWLSKAEKIKSGNEYAHCRACNTDFVAHKIDIVRHGQSAKHILSSKEIVSNKKLPEMFINDSSDIAIKRAELKLAGLLATNNLPFILMDVLSPLCADIFTDSKIAKNISLKRTKATALVKQSLGDISSRELFKTLSEPGCFFSLIMDETTDKAIKKQCAFTVIYFCKKINKVVTRFFDIVELSSGTAEGLYKCLKNVISEKKVPFANLVGFSADTCNAMFGEHNSVFALLKRDLPEIVCIKCSCHMIHLAASKACLKLPRSVEDLLRNLGSHFSRSFSRQEKFKEFQVFFKTEIHKILSPAVTRWLSLQACVNRVLEQYEPLTAYLRELVFEDPSRTTEDMLKSMTNKFTKIYMEFMSYSLGLLNEFNTLFQSETPLLHKVKPETERLLKTLCCNYLDISYVRGKNVGNVDHTNPRHFVELEKIYLGLTATESLQVLKTEPGFSQQEYIVFLKSCLSFYIELISEIKKRFVFGHPVFEIIKVVDPPAAQSFATKSLEHVLKAFPVLIKFIDPQKLDNEWREHALLDYTGHGIDASKPAEEYWQQIFNLRNAAGFQMFKALEVVINFLLVLPFSNVSVERIFSNLFNIKTDHRNKMNTDTLAALLHTKRSIESCGGIIKFEPNQAMLAANIWNKRK